MRQLKHRVFWSAFGFVLLLFYQNCGKPTDLQFDGSAELSSNQALQNSALRILQNNCYACHQPLNPMGNLSDVTNVDYLVYSQFVIPGKPDRSSLIDQVTQGLMPKDQTPLSVAEVEILKNWVTSLDPEAPLPEGPTAPAFATLVTQIFNPRCITCHANLNYKLSSYTEVMRVVTAGNADASLIYKSITVGQSGGKMPQGGSLSADDVKAIRDWINAGAPNN